MRRVRAIVAALCLGLAQICEIAVAADALELQIPAQPLDAALAALSRAADVQLLYGAALTEGQHSAALNGTYTVEQALSALLAGSDLVFTQTGEGTVLISRRGAPQTIGTVDIEGAPPARRKGVNGSSDVLATEGSGHYAARGAGVGSPYPQALKDTPRSISVLGRPQIEDQNLSELGDAVRRIPAVAVEATAADALQVSLRGRAMEFYQFDGGSVVPLLGGTLTGDLSAYDRIELLNGANGLGSGFIPPSGTLNLVRKRPLDQAQTAIQAQAGSWNHYRGMLDVSAAPVWDGRLRSRAVVSGVDRDLFFDYGEQQRQSFYGVIEADLGLGTLLRVGGQYGNQRGSPWEGASRPRDTSGGFFDPDGDRATTFALPWQRQEIRDQQTFVALEQSLAARWMARLSFEQRREERDTVGTEFVGTIDRETGQGGFMFPLQRANRNEYRVSDLAVNGRFDWLGREHILSLGLQHARYSLLEDFVFSNTFYLVDASDFDVADYPQPSFEDGLFLTAVDERNIRYGGTAALTLNPLDALSLITAWRWSSWSQAQYIDPDWPGLPQRSRETKQGLSYVAATWKLTSRWNIYTSWADAFVPVYLLLTPEGGAPSPVEGDNYEAGLKFASADERLQARLTLYRSERGNLPYPVDPETDNVWCCYLSGNGDRDRAQGVETEIVGTLFPGWELAAGYTYADLWERYTPNPAGFPDVLFRGIQVDPRTPRHALRAWTAWEPGLAATPGLRLGAGVRAQSRGLKDTEEYEGPGPQRQDAYTVVDLMAGWRFHPAWTAAVNVRNLFDRNYNDSVAIDAFYGEPRSVIFSVRGEL